MAAQRRPPIAALSAEQMRKVDRLMVEKYGINLIQMMENAGRNLAALARRLLGDSVADKRVLVAVGKGNNGGGGLVCARHLSNWGAEVVVLSPSKTLAGVPEMQRTALTNLDVVIRAGEAAVRFMAGAEADLLVDALIGYSLAGPPRGWTADVIKAINRLKLPVLALDVPSGLDATTGTVMDPCVKAGATMTLALPKKGLLDDKAKRVVGTIYLADISVPTVLYEEIGVSVGPIFSADTVIKLRD